MKRPMALMLVVLLASPPGTTALEAKKAAYVGGTVPSLNAAHGGGLERFGTDVDAISASYSYFNALIGSTRDARCAGIKPAHSATSASATADSASTAGSAPVV